MYDKFNISVYTRNIRYYYLKLCNYINIIFYKVEHFWVYRQKMGDVWQK